MLPRIKTGSKHRFSDCHTNGKGNSLSEGTGRRFNTIGDSDFRMTGTFSTHLTEVLYVIHAHLVTGKVQDRIEQH